MQLVHFEVFVKSQREQLPEHYVQLIPFKVYPKGQSVHIPLSQFVVLLVQEFVSKVYPPIQL